MINMIFVGQMSELVENFNIGIYSDTINVINVKLCIIVPLIDLHLFKPVDRISRSLICRYVEQF